MKQDASLDSALHLRMRNSQPPPPSTTTTTTHNCWAITQQLWEHFMFLLFLTCLLRILLLWERLFLFAITEMRQTTTFVGLKFRQLARMRFHVFGLSGGVKLQRHTHTHTDSGSQIIKCLTICYECGADLNVEEENVNSKFKIEIKGKGLAG